MAYERTRVLKLTRRVHPWLYRVTNGRLGGRPIKMPGAIPVVVFTLAG